MVRQSTKSASLPASSISGSLIPGGLAVLAPFRGAVPDAVSDGETHHVFPLGSHYFRACTELHVAGLHPIRMFESLKGRARRFLTAPSGTRFRAYHARLAQRPSLMRTLLAIGCGLILLALGLVMVVLPGPGLLVAAIGAVLIAGESMWAARLLDRVDLCMTTKWKRWRRR